MSRQLDESGFNGILEVPLPDSSEAFTFAREIDLNQLRKSHRHHIKVAEQNEESGVNVIETLGEFQKSVAEAKYYMVIKSLKNKSKQVRDVRSFGGKAELETYLALNDKIEALSEQYGVPFQKLCSLFGQTSGDIANLERHLKGETVPLWNELEDMALLHPEDTEMYKFLIASKGPNEIKKRKAYLEIAT